MKKNAQGKAGNPKITSPHRLFRVLLATETHTRHSEVAAARGKKLIFPPETLMFSEENASAVPLADDSQNHSFPEPVPTLYCRDIRRQQMFTC
jgi:hypothetical protein